MGGHSIRRELVVLYSSMQTSTILSSMELSDRAQSIPPSITLAISAKVKEMKAAGKEIIAFGAGEPDFDTPEEDF